MTHGNITFVIVLLSVRSVLEFVTVVVHILNSRVCPGWLGSRALVVRHTTRSKQRRSERQNLDVMGKMLINNVANTIYVRITEMP